MHAPNHTTSHTQPPLWDASKHSYTNTHSYNTLPPPSNKKPSKTYTPPNNATNATTILTNSSSVKYAPKNASLKDSSSTPTHYKNIISPHKMYATYASHTDSTLTPLPNANLDDGHL